MSELKRKEKGIALSRIRELFSQARIMYSSDPSLSDRYVALALKIGMKLNVSIPAELRQNFCKNCNKFLVPGSNCRVRLGGRKVIYFCQSCKHFRRIKY
jgi:ribonuclease P protein subunit RPR2